MIKTVNQEQVVKLNFFNVFKIYSTTDSECEIRKRPSLLIGLNSNYLYLISKREL